MGGRAVTGFGELMRTIDTAVADGHTALQHVGQLDGHRARMVADELERLDRFTAEVRQHIAGAVR
jgi:hypothetical protein